MRALRLAVALLCAGATATAGAADDEEVIRLRNTVNELMRTLVASGVLTPEQAEKMVVQARDKASREVAEVRQVKEKENAIRVPYVPQFVVDKIRADVKAELKQEVAREVATEARKDGWGVEKLPGWVPKVKLYADVRLRPEMQTFASDNGQWVDYQRVNEKGRLDTFGNIDDLLINPDNADRERLRARARFGLEAVVNEDLKLGLGLATGNTTNPVSTNQTLGNYGNKYTVVLDRAFLEYKLKDDQKNDWLALWGGRFANPFFSTDLVWDDDLGFEGVAGQLRYYSGSASETLGVLTRSREATLTAGAFPLQEFGNEFDDKWLFGLQGAGSLKFLSDSTLTLGVGYYYYDGITGKLDARFNPNFENDASIPRFVQKGNTLFDIYPNNSKDLYGLASDYELLNVTAKYDFAQFHPIHVWVIGDYVKNLAYDENDVRQRIGTSTPTNPTDGDHDTGWLAKVGVGWQKIENKGEWDLSLGYKYLEPDAVLDAFTDSDFHLGGTNAKGWFLGGRYGFARNSWLALRVMSANEVVVPNAPKIGIDTGPLGVDTFQLDVNAKF